MALGVSGSLDYGVWDSPIIHEYSETRCRGTTAPLSRVRRGLVGAPDIGGAVDTGYAAQGSFGGLSLPLAGSTGVAVRVTDPVPRVNGKCGLRVPRILVVPLGLMVGPRGVLTSW